MRRPICTQRQSKSRLGYPQHGVGKITAIEKQETAGEKLDPLVIHFKTDKMTPALTDGERGQARPA